MKKNGRKYRKIQRENAEWKKNHPQKVEKSPEKAQEMPQEPWECMHFIPPIRTYKFTLPATYFLQKISDTECECSKCGKRYPIKKMDEIKKMVWERSLRMLLIS